MELGQNRKKRLVPDDEEFIDPGFFHLEFTINGMVFKKAVDGLLAFESEALEELTDSDIDKALVQCSYYRFTFLAAGAEVEARLSTVEREYLIWYAGASEKARSDIMTERKKVKERDKIPNSWFGSITKQEIENKLLLDTDSLNKFVQHQEQVADMKKHIKLLYGLRDILQDRGGHLQSIGRRKLENRKMNFGVSNARP